MPDNKRIDLSGDLDALSGELLNDVRAAAESEKKRQNEISTRGIRAEEKAQSKRLSIVIVAVATIAILCLSFWMYGRNASIDHVELQRGQQQRVKINQPSTIQPAPQTSTTTRSQGRQLTEHPPTDYDQPSEDPGM